MLLGLWRKSGHLPVFICIWNTQRMRKRRETEIGIKWNYLKNCRCRKKWMDKRTVEGIERKEQWVDFTFCVCTRMCMCYGCVCSSTCVFCVWTDACMRLYMQLCADVCGGQRSTLFPFSEHHLPYFWDESSLAWNFLSRPARLVGESQNSTCLSFLSTLTEWDVSSA